MTRIVMGIDRNTNHDVVLRFTDFDIGSHGEVVFEHAVKPEDIPNFMRDIANACANALTDVGAAMAYGDCPTCKNYRLVNEPRHGRDWQVSCPDCAADGRPIAFRSYPTYGGGMSDDVKGES